MAQTAITAEIHQSLDVHRYQPAQITLDRVFAIDQFANPQHLFISQFMHPPFRGDPDPAANLDRRRPADAVDISQADWYPLLIRDVDASNARHLRFSSKT